MRAFHRIVLLATLAAFASALTACSNFDPDKLDVFGLSEKKKLPGERKEVFPGGVPGVTQGIPPEYVRGNQPPPDAAQPPAPQQGNQTQAGEPDSKTAAVEPEPKPKAKPKPKPKPRTASQPPAQITVQRPPQTTAPWPQQQQQPEPQQGQAPWPTQEQSISR
jgi:outer membrane biosynthesis protein TonB